MPKISIQSKGIKQAIEINDEISKSLDELNLQQLRELAESIIVEAGLNLQSNGNVMTGELLKSIKILSEGTNYVVVGTDSEHAIFIEFGRGPVFSVNGKVLHWKDPFSGEDVFAKSSDATEPTPFLQPAVTRKTKKFKDVYVEQAKRSINNIS